MTEIVVTRLRDFVDSHRDIQFPHRHDFYQIVLFTRGGGQHSIDFRQYEVLAHQVYYMAPSQIHTWNFDAETEGYLVNFNESFFTSICHNPHFVREFPLFSNISGASVNTLDMSCCAEVEQTFAQMLDEFTHGGDYTMDILRGMLMVILVRLSRVVPVTFKEGASKHNVVLMRQLPAGRNGARPRIKRRRFAPTPPETHRDQRPSGCVSVDIACRFFSLV